MLAALFVAGLNTTACFVISFFGQVLLNLNWAIVADILLVRDQMPFLFPPFDGCGPFLKNYSRFLFNNSCFPILVHRHSNKTIDCRSVPNSIFARAGWCRISLSHWTGRILFTLKKCSSLIWIYIFFLQISEILKKTFSTTATSVTSVATELLHNTTASGIISDFSMSSPDSISPNCTGTGSSSIDLTTVEGDFKALQWAMSITIVVELLGALFFFGTAWYITNCFPSTHFPH